MATFVDSITQNSIDLATLNDADLWKLRGIVEFEVNRRAILATSADRLKALFEEYEKAGGTRGLLIDSVDSSIRNPSGAVHSDISAPF